MNSQIEGLYTAILAHPLQWFLGYWIFSNLVLYMPPPEANSSPLYKWAFGVLHAIAGAVPRIASNFLPQGSWIAKLLAGGNGLTNGGTSIENPQPAPKVDGAPPKG